MLKDYAKKSTKTRLLDDVSNRYNDYHMPKQPKKSGLSVSLRLSPIMLALIGVLLGFSLAAFIFLHVNGKLSGIKQVVTAPFHRTNKLSTRAKSQTITRDVQNAKKTRSVDDPTQNLALSAKSSSQETTKRDLNQRLQQTQKGKPKTESHKKTTPTFQFYHILANPGDNGASNTDNTTTTTPDNIQKTSEAAAKPASSSAKPQLKDSLTIHVASFQHHSRVSPFRARLLLLGLSPSVKTLKLKGKTTYQVLLGPFQNKRALNRVKVRLTKNGINTNAANQDT